MAHDLKQGVSQGASGTVPGWKPEHKQGETGLAVGVRVSRLRRLLEEGGVIALTLTTKTASAEVENGIFGSTQYGKRLNQGAYALDFHECLMTPGISTEDRISLCNYGMPAHPIVHKLMDAGFNHQKNNFVLSLPKIGTTMERRVVKEKKFLRTVEKVENVQKLCEIKNERILSFSIVSPRLDNSGRTGQFWCLGLRCTDDAAAQILSDAPQTHRELFDFFVEVVPGFAQLEGKSYEEYVKAVGDMLGASPGKDPANFNRRALSSIEEIRALPS